MWMEEQEGEKGVEGVFDEEELERGLGGKSSARLSLVGEEEGEFKGTIANRPRSLFLEVTLFSFTWMLVNGSSRL